MDECLVKPVIWFIVGGRIYITLYNEQRRQREVGHYPDHIPTMPKSVVEEERRRAQ